MNMEQGTGNEAPSTPPLPERERGPGGEVTLPHVLSSTPIYKGRIIDVRVDEIEIEPGRVFKRDVVSHPGAVVILPVDAQGRILWITQYRYAAARTLLELPAGTLEEGEEPLETAKREIVEEVGFAADTWHDLGGFYSAPGFCSEYLFAYLATGLHEDQADGDEDEDITVLPLTLEETYARLDAGEIIDAKSIATLLLYLRHARL
jgi:ADP-ribose pyrophosphatase